MLRASHTHGERPIERRTLADRDLNPRTDT